MPVNFNELQKKAIEEDQNAFQRSDADFALRHKPTVQAERLFEAQTLKDQQGESELLPAVQNEFMRSGLEGALGAFGSTGANLTPGGAGEAAVARNLGISILGFQDRNRTNRQNSLRLAEDIFQRRQFGLNGQDATNISVDNQNAQNAYNQQIYANQVGADEKNLGIASDERNSLRTTANANAQAEAAQKAALVKAVGDGVGSLASAYGQSRGAQTGYGATSVSGAPKPAVVSTPGNYALPANYQRSAYQVQALA